jgi:hypothetical protein
MEMILTRERQGGQRQKAAIITKIDMKASKKADKSRMRASAAPYDVGGASNQGEHPIGHGWSLYAG